MENRHRFQYKTFSYPHLALQTAICQRHVLVYNYKLEELSPSECRQPVRHVAQVTSEIWEDQIVVRCGTWKKMPVNSIGLGGRQANSHVVGADPGGDQRSLSSAEQLETGSTNLAALIAERNGYIHSSDRPPSPKNRGSNRQSLGRRGNRSYRAVEAPFGGVALRQTPRV